MDLWQTGTKAKNVREIIENNIRSLGKDIKNVNNKLQKVCYFVTTKERQSLSYLQVNGTIVYDLDDEKWYKRENNEWIEENINEQIGEFLVCEFTFADWNNGEISILYSEHQKFSPLVQLFIKVGDNYEPVLGGYYINDNDDVIIKSDITYSGKVVVR